MTILHPVSYSMERFGIGAVKHGSETMFTAEASDLKNLSGGGFRLGRVYDDACDVGFTMVSHHTGKEVVFRLEHREMDREGDLLWWDFSSVTLPHKGKFTVRVYND